MYRKGVNVGKVSFGTEFGKTQGMKTVVSILLLFYVSLAGFGQTKPPLASLDTLPEIKLPRIDYKAFKEGEYLKFVLHYGIIDAGEAELHVGKSPHTYHGHEAYHIVGTGKTLGAFNWFFKVRDKYETYLDKNGVFPWEFVRNIQEGGYNKRQDYLFYQHKAAVKTDKGEVYKIPPLSQDMLSTFYYARTLDFSNLYEGQIFTIPTFVDGETFPLKIKYRGREQIEVRSGKYRCLKFVPVVQQGRIFKEEDDMIVWITDDDNRILVLAQAKVLVGSIKMELVKFENLANPISKISD